MDGVRTLHLVIFHGPWIIFEPWLASRCYDRSRLNQTNKWGAIKFMSFLVKANKIAKGPRLYRFPTVWRLMNAVETTSYCAVRSPSQPNSKCETGWGARGRMEETTQPKNMLQEGRPNHQQPRTPERAVCIEEQGGAGEGSPTKLQKGKSITSFLLGWQVKYSSVIR